MLTLEIYGSSSKGNCYVLDNGKNKIMLDCGVKKLNEKTDLNTINGVILTHLHSDHTKGVKDIKDLYKGNYYGNKETLDILPIIDGFKAPICENQKFYIGSFAIVPFELEHDVKCFGYLIKDTISNTKILYITDTGMINYSFKDIDYFLIESNCDENDLTYDDYKEVRLYNTHLSCQQTLDFLQGNTNYNTKKVILCHISSNEENYLKHQEFIKNGLSNENIEVLALDPHMKTPITIELKKDLEGFDFN